MFKATDASSGLTLSLTQAPSFPAWPLGLWLYLPRHFHNVKALHVITLHTVYAAYIVVFLFIQEILFSVAWYQGACNSPGDIPFRLSRATLTSLSRSKCSLSMGGGSEGFEGKLLHQSQYYCWRVDREEWRSSKSVESVALLSLIITHPVCQACARKSKEKQPASGVKGRVPGPLFPPKKGFPLFLTAS